MPVKIYFDPANNPIAPTLILANRNGNYIGVIECDNITIKDSLNSASELTFDVYKYLNGRKNYLWDEIKDFKLVYCKEQNMWFEATVEVSESYSTVKTVYCTQLGIAELSQIMIYDTEINTEDDIAREDYIAPTILFDETNHNSSLLHRITEKAQHYSFVHVDSTIAKMQRAFSFNDISIYDAFQEISEELSCLFVLNSDSDKDGKIRRTISVYDLYSNCNSCEYRGQFTFQCPKCKSCNINEGYGEDTNIFITSDELSEDIKLNSNTESVKNCFKLIAGDELMTSVIKNCNPNNSDYIWYISNETKRDMSDSLIEKINSYDTMYYNYQNNDIEISNVDTFLEYNYLIEKYKIYNNKLESINELAYGYSDLIKNYYNVIDFELYLQSSLMPNPEISDTNASIQAELLTSENLSIVSISNLESISKSSADNAVLNVAKTIIDKKYKVKIKDSNFENNIWIGNFIITNYFNEDDVAESSLINITISDNYELFIKQSLQNVLSKNNKDNFNLSKLFNMNHLEFGKKLKKYSLNSLISILDCCQSCIDILIEQGISNLSTWSDKNDSPNLYDDLYLPYYNKLSLIESEIKIRESEIDIIKNIKNHIKYVKNNIQEKLDFKNFLGEQCWNEFITFRREDKYTNNNYISDGLNNAELIEKAQEFLETANEEIHKASEIYYSISTSIQNLLLTNKFKKITKFFKVGNWIRLQIDNKIYKLRLLSYEIDFNDIEKINVKFSDTIRIMNSLCDIQNILSQANSMSTSYEYTQKQANQGAKSTAILENWDKNGLNTENTKIICGAENQSQTWDSHGMLFRKYNDTSNTYDETQLKIINSTIAITDNNWRTTKTAIGKFYYTNPITKETESVYGINGEVVIGKLLIGENLEIHNESNSLSFNSDGLIVSNNINTVIINPNNDSIFTIKNNSGNVLSFDENGILTIVGDIIANKLTLSEGVTIDADRIATLATVATTGQYKDLENKPNLSNVATSGEYKDLLNKPDLNTKFDIPINNITADNGNILSKQDNNSIWIPVENSITKGNLSPICGDAVYNYALPKNLKKENANKLLCTDSNGDIILVSPDIFKTPKIYMTDTNMQIEPNKMYIWGEVENLTITLSPDENNSFANQYYFIFESGESPTTLNLPNEIFIPFSIEKNKKYKITITENILDVTIVPK